MEEVRPLQYIDERPFPELSLTIDCQPVRIAHTKSFDEEVDHKTVSLATAVATTLWLWHPNALRAFLDFEKFPQVEWTRRNTGESFYNTCVIARFDRQVVVSYTLGAGAGSPQLTANAGFQAGFYNRDISWAGQCIVEIKSSGAWLPTHATLYDKPVSNPRLFENIHRDVARQMFYHNVWESIAPGLQHGFYLYEREKISLGLRSRNPQTIYLLGDVPLCEQCVKSSQELEIGMQLKYCARCHNTLYCSIDCQKKDWGVHKYICGKKNGGVSPLKRRGTQSASS